MWYNGVIMEDVYKKYFDYLEALRQTGVTNMFGAAPYLVEMFGVDKKEARTILMKWMESYGKKT